MLWCDVKYVLLVSHRLRNFQRKSEFLFNCSCPFCGDSLRRPRAARGYFYRKGDQLNYDCKKCGRGMSAKNFIKAFDPLLFEEMRLELFVPKKAETIPNLRPEHPVFDKSINPFRHLTKLSELPKTHFCRQYAEGRLIPFLDDLYFTPTFYKWAGEVLPGRYKVPKDDRDDEPRLVIPFRNRKGEVTAFQGRQLVGEDTGQKYVYLALTKNEPLIWGLDKIDSEKNIYVLEGPFDAMFLPNAIACGGGDLVNDVLRAGLPRENLVIVYDNEPRKAGTVNKIQKAIDRGMAVCIWPDISGKDINDMVKSRIRYGLAEACRFVFDKINERIYSGISANLALSSWKKTREESTKKADRSLWKSRSGHPK